MLISNFDYDLPEQLIAQKPLDRRDASRMLVVDRQRKSWIDSEFSSFTTHLRTSDVVVINNTRVLPARLAGRRKDSGGKVEVFLVRQLAAGLWEALVRPGNRLRSGSIVLFGNDQLSAEIRNEPGNGLRQVEFHYQGTFEDLLTKIGSTPLPPYIKRPFGVSYSDKERYQTVYSRHLGAIAAPTAGLHFTPEVLSQVKAKCRLAEITLHIGYGTFEPVRVTDVEKHRVRPERFEISEAAAGLIAEGKAAGGRVIAVGTTTLRALESASNEEGIIGFGSGEAQLTIVPGFEFRAVDALLTNFHLPRSSLLLLVSAFAGRELTLDAYHHAVRQCYRFYSYGDCMLIL
jgi:S-adenosylmethionine:tRNA ribosyltransferase-isomerase